MVRKLWEACQIPDFRKLADETHTRLCGRVFGHVAGDGAAADRLAGRPDRRAGPGGRRYRHADAATGRDTGLVLHRRPVRLGEGRAALAGPRPRGGGPAVGRAARTADEPLRRSPRRASDAPAGGGRGAGTAVRRDPPRRGGGRGPPGRPYRRLRVPPRSRNRRRGAEARVARRPPGAARRDAAARRRRRGGRGLGVLR